MKWLRLTWFWRVEILKAFLTMIVAGGTTFLASTDQFSTEGWKELGLFEQLRYFGYALVSSVAALVAFLHKAATVLDPEHAAEMEDESPKPPNGIGITK